jgi:hypothetical protein
MIGLFDKCRIEIETSVETCKSALVKNIVEKKKLLLGK